MWYIVWLLLVGLAACSPGHEDSEARSQKPNRIGSSRGQIRVNLLFGGCSSTPEELARMAYEEAGRQGFRPKSDAEISVNFGWNIWETNIPCAVRFDMRGSDEYVNVTFSFDGKPTNVTSGKWKGLH